MSIGIRARAQVSLVDDPDPARAWGALASGSRSLLFQFSAIADSDQELVSVGAMLTTPDERPLAWGEMDREVLLNFWDDAARIHVHDGADFMVWYSRTIGTGVITGIVDDLDA